MISGRVFVVGRRSLDFRDCLFLEWLFDDAFATLRNWDGNNRGRAIDLVILF